MKLLEYEAKQILESYDIPVPFSEHITTTSVPSKYPIILKSQVPTGGRGKAGGIVKVKTEDQFAKVAKKLFSLSIQTFTPSVLLAEELLDIEKEFYFSLLIDRSSSSIILLTHSHGGVEVESNMDTDYLKLPIYGGSFDSTGLKLSEYLDLPEQAFALTDIVEKLYRVFVENDATLIEINPLVLTKDNRLVTGDCKMELDDAASFRHPEWNFEAETADANFVTINPSGNVATIANGAGLAMATVDGVASAGLKPANFLDIGGGASASSVLAAFERIMKFENIEAIVINIFAGITRCDQVAEAIITAKKQISSLPPLYIRLSGTGYEKAVRLLEAESIPTLPDLTACIDAVKENSRG